MSIAPEPAVKQGSENAPPAAALSKVDLETVQRRLAEIRARIKRSTRLTAVIGALVLLVLTLYFSYGAYLWAEVTQPEKLTALGETYIEDNLPGIRQSLAKQLIAAAPGWAAELSKKMVAEMPASRQRMEGFLIEQLDTALQEADLVTEKEFRKFLTKNRALMDKRFKELATRPKLADESLAEIVAALENEIDVDLHASAAELFKTLKGANRNWKDMLAGGKLSDEQKLELRAWTLARRLILEQTEPGRLNELRSAPPRSQPRSQAAKRPPVSKAAPRKTGKNVAQPKKKP